MNNLLNLVIGKKEKVCTLDEIMFNVQNFNIWFCHPNNKAIYANSGIFLRLDKLSQSQIKDYLNKSYGVKEYDNYKIQEFEKQIREDWKNKLNK